MLSSLEVITAYRPLADRPVSTELDLTPQPARYVVGIDLGTSNCAVAFADVTQGAAATVTDFPIAQLQRPGQVGTQPLLPSCLYIPAEQEMPAGAARLPWASCSVRSPWAGSSPSAPPASTASSRRRRCLPA